MTKSILISIRPEHVLNILNGHKTLELRKRVPKNFKGWVYVYVTKGKRLSVVHDDENGHTYYYLDSNWGRSLNQYIPFRFWFDDFDDVATKYHIDKNQIERVIEQACISYEDFDKYVGDRENVYGWHIKNLEIFDEPMALGDFYKANYETNYLAFILKEVKDDKYISNEIIKGIKNYPITKAPQSWQYVWVKGK